MKYYKNYKYFLDTDGLWKVILSDSIFIIALDDSKFSGKRKIISSKNNEESCKKYIDVISLN